MTNILKYCCCFLLLQIEMNKFQILFAVCFYTVCMLQFEIVLGLE